MGGGRAEVRACGVEEEALLECSEGMGGLGVGYVLGGSSRV